VPRTSVNFENRVESVHPFGEYKITNALKLDFSLNLAVDKTRY
jgi:hypothetical protein